MYTYPVERLVETAKANQTFLYFAPTNVRQQQAEIVRPPTQPTKNVAISTLAAENIEQTYD